MKLLMLLVGFIIGGIAAEPNRPTTSQRNPNKSQKPPSPYRSPNLNKSPYPQPPFPQLPFPQWGQFEQPSYGPVSSGHCDSQATPKCLKNVNQTFCLKDTEYPEKEIKRAIDLDPLVIKKYADAADQSANNMVNGLTSLEEKSFDYSLYNGNPFAKGNWVGGQGYICPSDVLYARPSRAKNVDGDWRVIVQNVDSYTQTQRLETCLYSGASCRTLAPCHRSKCLQKYVHHRMLSYDPCDPKRGLFIDVYKLPSACSCHISAKHR